MAPSTPDDTANGDGPGRPWHDRPASLAATSVLGVTALAALMFSVVHASDTSHPVAAQVTEAPATVPPTMTTTAPPTAVAASPAEPPPAIAATHFAAGPTAELMVVRPDPPAPAPFQLPDWLQRLLHPGPG